MLDLAIARAGPTCTRQLADMGADVIQVVDPTRADLTGSDAHNLHRGKRSIAIDLKSEAGRGAFYRLAEKADVLVENFRADVKHRLKIDYETLAAKNPRLVYGSLSGFGQDGPYASRPGVDQIAQGMGGLMSVTGPPGSGPWRAGIAISDTASGTFLTQGILAALFARERTGRGQWVQTSLLETMINLMDFQATRWTVDGEVPPQAGNDHPTFFPMGTFKTTDGHINIAATGAAIYERFSEVMQRPDWLTDERFRSPGARSKNRDAMNAEIEAITVGRSSEAWIKAFNDAGVPAGYIYSIDEVFNDPQVKHLQMASPVHHPELGDISLVAQPITLSDAPFRIRSATPKLGEHTDEVLGAIGYTDGEIEQLRLNEVV